MTSLHRRPIEELIRLARIDFIQRGLHQDEGLLNKFMELVDLGQSLVSLIRAISPVRLNA
jgi:hypothetical protein